MKSLYRNMAQAVAVIALIASTSPAGAEDLEERDLTLKSLDLVRTAKAPKIDGRLDEPEWQQAAFIDDFHQTFPVEGNRPSQRTEAWIMYDADMLYIGIHAYDTEPNKITATQLAQGKTVRADDRIWVVLDPFQNKRTGYGFFLNPNGVRRQGLYESPYEINSDWNGIWYADARIVEDGWVAEVAIPFKTINFDTSLENWGFSLGRAIKRNNERIAWTSHNGHTNPSSTGELRGIKDIDQGLGLDIVPSLALKAKYDHGTDDSEFDAIPSLDVFYKVTPSLTTILTLNTDFSATDVDDRVVNLSRFSVFFPEKRAFFLQDSDIFNFAGIEGNGKAFFSRKIGLSDEGEPVDILAGLKATGRIGPMNIGMLNVLQDEQPGLGIDQQNLFVARASANLFRESSAGLIFTHGNPNGNDENMLAGADLNFSDSRIVKGKTTAAGLWYQKTDSENLEGDDQAYGAYFGLFGRDGFKTDLFFTRIEENFNPALGFVNWTGITEVGNWSEYSHRLDQSPWLREVSMSWYFEDVKDHHGRLQSRVRNIQPLAFETKADDEVWLRLKRLTDVLYDPFEISDGVIIPPGRYTFNRQELMIKTSNARPVSSRTHIDIGEFYDGDRLRFTTDIQWRVNKHVFLGTGFRYNDIDLSGGRFITRLATLRANFALNSKWSVLNFVQYDNVSDTVGLNSRIRWNPTPGKEVYFVANYNGDVDEDGMVTSTETELVLKSGYTFRF